MAGTKDQDQAPTDDGFVTVEYHEFPDVKVDWDETKAVAGTLLWREPVETTGLNGEPRKTTFYAIADADGATVGVWGTANLDPQLAKVPDGSQVRIAYIEKKKLTGGRTLRRFEVAYKA
jgi:hypothetical protein